MIVFLLLQALIVTPLHCLQDPNLHMSRLDCGLSHKREFLIVQVLFVNWLSALSLSRHYSTSSLVLFRDFFYYCPFPLCASAVLLYFTDRHSGSGKMLVHLAAVWCVIAAQTLSLSLPYG